MEPSGVFSNVKNVEVVLILEMHRIKRHNELWTQIKKE